MLNAIYKNETNVIFSLKLNDEAAHGQFYGIVESGRSMRVERSKNGQSGRSAKIEGPEVWIALKRGKFGRSFDHKEDGPILSKNLSYYL